jgi:hypothetical protein
LRICVCMGEMGATNNTPLPQIPTIPVTQSSTTTSTSTTNAITPTTTVTWTNVLLYLMSFTYCLTTLGCLPSGDTGALIQLLWSKYVSGPWTRSSVQIMLDSILFMVGRAGNGTPFHLDWANAINVAFAITEEHKTNATPLAMWSFIDPIVLATETLSQAMDTWCEQNLHKYHSTTEHKPNQRLFNQQVDRNPSNNLPTRPILTYNDMLALDTYLNDHSGVESRSYITHILQRHGDVITVNVGWAHQVINLQPCVKYAFDYASAHEATQCIHTNNVFHTRFKNVHPTDYRGMEREATLAGRLM